MRKQGRTHLSDPGARAQIVGLVVVIPAVLLAVAVAGPSPAWTFTALGLLVLIIVAYARLSWRLRRETSLWLVVPKTRLDAQQLLEAQFALARATSMLDALQWLRLLQRAVIFGELETLHAIATQWLTSKSERQVGDRAHTTLVALAGDALACVAMGDTTLAAAQIARYDAMAREQPAAANAETNVLPIAELARAWIHARNGRPAEASAIVSAWRMEIGCLRAPLVRVARSMSASQDARSPSAPTYRDSAQDTTSGLHWQRTYSFIESEYEDPSALPSLPSVALRRSLRPLPLPPPHPKSRASVPRPAPPHQWGYIVAAVLLLGMFVGALALQQPFVCLATLVGAAVLAMDYRNARGTDKAGPSPSSKDEALLFDAVARSKTDRAGARAALEEIAARGSGVVAAKAAQRLAAIVELEGDAAGALRWHEHALATLHRENANRDGVFALRQGSASARAILLAANGRYEEAERALLVLPRRDPHTTRSTALVRLTRMAHENDVAGARAMCAELPQSWLPEGWKLLRDALFAQQDPELAREVALRVASWPDGFGWLRTISPAHAAAFAPSVQRTAAANDAPDAPEQHTLDAALPANGPRSSER